MFTNFLTTIFGKKESIQRRIIKTAILYILIVIAIAAFLFYVFVQRSINIKLIEINEQQGQSIKDLLNISSRSIRVSIVSILLITIALMQNISRKIVNPIKKITDATKKVASGDFTIELETKRDDEIGELTHNFNKMVKELNSIECLQKDFINNVSHEIKTPISSIQGFAKLLEADDLSKEERKEYAEIIKEESDRLLYLSTNILKLAKLENQERIMNKTKFNIAEQIRRTISVLEPKWKEKNIKFNVSLKEQEFLGEKDLMYQVWMNIIENSIKFSKQDGQIDVKMKTNQDSIIVEIKDYGIGMEEEEAKKIFDRFYQVDKSHTKPGAGLGMTIAKRIVELSGGKIEVTSKLNESTTFIVTLPIKFTIFVIIAAMLTILFIFIRYYKNKLKEKDLRLFHLSILSVVAIELTVTMFLTPYWLQTMYGIPFFASQFVRILKSCVMIPVGIIIVYTMNRMIQKVIR